MVFAFDIVIKILDNKKRAPKRQNSQFIFFYLLSDYECLLRSICDGQFYTNSQNKIVTTKV